MTTQQFIIEPFNYQFVLDTNTLTIRANHIKDCFEWCAIVTNQLDPLTPEIIFGMISDYRVGELQSTKIVFPKSYDAGDSTLVINIVNRLFLHKYTVDKTTVLTLDHVPVSEIVRTQHQMQNTYREAYGKFKQQLIADWNKIKFNWVGCAIDCAVDCAAGNDGEFIKIIQWFGKHSNKSTLMDNAATDGLLNIVAWLHENKYNCTVDAMDLAACYGHLDVVKFLHEKRLEGCTTYAMNHAAYCGHLDVVKFLHENRDEGCTQAAMDFGFHRCRIDVIKYLHIHRPEVDIIVGMNTLSLEDPTRVAIVEWLR